MQNRPAISINDLPLEIIIKIASQVSLMDLIAITRIATSENNPFPNLITDPNIWKEFVYQDFPHLVNGLPISASRLEQLDWRSFYIECYERTYTENQTHTLKLASRKVKLMILANSGDIEGLKAENIQFDELFTSISSFPGKTPRSLPINLYELAFNNQELANYLYNHIVVPFYQKEDSSEKIKLTSMIDWAILFNQPIETIQKMGQAINLTLPLWVIDDSHSIFLKALQIGNLSVIRYLRNLIVEDAIHNFPNSTFFKKIIEHSPLETVKEITSNSIIPPHEIESLMLSAICNPNSGVFEFIFEKYSDKLNIQQTLPLLFKEAISLGNVNVFSYLFNKLDDNAYTNAKSYLKTNLISLTINMLDSFILDHHKINFAKLIINDLLNFTNPTKQDLDKLKFAVMKNINAPVLKDLLEIIYKRQGSELTEAAYKGDIHYILSTNSSYFNDFAVKEMLALYPDMLPRDKQIDLLLRSLSHSFYLFKKLFRLIKTHRNPLLPLLNDETLDNISAIHPNALEFIALESPLHTPQVTSVLHKLLLKSEADSCKQVISKQSIYSADKNSYLIDLLRYAVNHYEESISLFIISTYPDIVKLHLKDFIKLLNETNFCFHILTNKYLSTDILVFLLKAGMHPQRMHREFETPHFPLNIAAQEQNNDFFDALVQHGADIQQAFDCILSSLLKGLKGQYEYEPNLKYKIFPSELKKEIEFFIGKGIQIDSIDANGHTLLVRALPESPLDLQLKEKDEMVAFLIQNQANATLAFRCIQGNKHRAGDGRWTKIELNRFEYLLNRSAYLNVNNLEIIKKLFAYIKTSLNRKDDDYNHTFNIFNKEVKLPLQRSALQKRLAANALLSVVLGSENKKILDDFEEDFGSSTDLGKIYLEWKLSEQDSRYIARPSK